MTSGEFFSQVKKHYDDELPFVAFRKPHEPFINGFLQNDSILHTISDFSESGFVFAPFDDAEKSILIPSSNSKKITCDFKQISAIERLTFCDAHSNEQKQFHLKLVGQALDDISKNKFQKVVLSRSERIQIDATGPLDIFKRLLNKYDSAFVYCWYHPKIGLWLGASPEILLQAEGNRLTTMALAGTQKFEGNDDVEWQEKEREEQQIVTRFLVESLRSSTESLKVGNLQTVKAGNLLHLKTEITATFKRENLNLQNILQILHPTPAVCGLPKEKSKEFILQNENYTREFYTGFLGELNIKERKSRNINRHNIENDAYASVKNVSNLYVNLRCMQLRNNHAIIYIGGGITKDSIPEQEWEETVIKSQVIKSIL